MRPQPKTILLLGALLACAATAEARAQSRPLEGTYVFVEQGSDDVHQAIEQAIAKMNFVTRPVARGRLRKTNNPYRSITIRHTPDQVTLTTDQRAPISTPANGSPIRWKREDGEVLDVSTRWDDGALQQSFAADDGKRVNTYSLAPDGESLLMKVTVTSPRLPQPLTYTLRYRRQQ